jgi:hypothetical protein
VERSNALSAQSKMFYKTAKKVRSRNVIGRTADCPAKLVLCGHVRGGLVRVHSTLYASDLFAGS